MYLTKEQVTQMLAIIRDNFDNAYVIMECGKGLLQGKE